MKYFRKLEFFLNLWVEKHRGTNKDAKRFNKSSYRTSSSTPGTPKLPAVHVQTRSITTGGCSPESTRGTTSKREKQKQSCPFLPPASLLSLTLAQGAALWQKRVADRRVKSRWSGVTIKVKSQTAAREQLPVQTFKIHLKYIERKADSKYGLIIQENV